MSEEIIISGRNLPYIDPVLNIWHWPIPLYLFLGGLAAGILFFASLYTILNRCNCYSTAVKKAPIIAPFALVLGLIALIFDLKNPLYFWQLLTTFRIDSPMSWGAWTLVAITPLSIMWVMGYLKEVFPIINFKHRILKLFKIIVKPTENLKQNWDWKYNFLSGLEKFIIRKRMSIAWVQIVLAVILGVYTGILLSAFNARPLWNTSILGPLFLVSGMSTAAAIIIWLSKHHREIKTFIQIDILLITIELFFIIHMFMGFKAGSQVQIEAIELFMGGAFTFPFWGLVVGMGMILPAILDILELKGKKIPAFIPSLLVLAGGVMFRFIIVESGQITRYLY